MGHLLNPKAEPNGKPCDATTLAVLGVLDPRGGAVVRCGGLAGHDGLHLFRIEWRDPIADDADPGRAR